MLRAGDLDRRLRLQRLTFMKDSFNADVPVWSDILEVAASKLDVSDAERLANAEVGAVVTTRFRIRWSPEVADLSAKDRGICEGATYEITGVKELGRREGLELTAARRGD